MTKKARSFPDLLTEAEKSELLKVAEDLWANLQNNDIGGFSGINRPIYIFHEFRKAIEKFGYRDTGLKWSKDQLDGRTPPPLLEVDP